MSSIDKRVVEMKFDNNQFESGVKTTMSTLDKLKQGLNFGKSGESLKGLSGLMSKLGLGGVAAGVENISSKFSALGAVAFTVIQNITNRLVDMSLTMAKSFTVQPIIDGFREYELKMGSIQTILANTARHGTTLDEVSASLNSLNDYADKTIYNFGDMTRNIGLFTNAGLELEESVSMIKGFSNAAAASGTNAQGASHAAYQLSQALSTGTIRLMDWRSLTNVGMGNKNMQTDLIQIAEAMGTLEASGTTAAEVQQDFNSSLQDGWLSADVMSKYLQIMAGDMDETAMKQLGLGDAQIESLLKQQKTAEEAATKVRTFTQLIDTMKEAVGSGWAQTFELLLGDFDQASEMFTKINDTVSPIIDNLSNSRNELLGGWAELGGRDTLLAGLADAFGALGDIIKPITEAFQEIFPPMTAKRLADMTKAFADFTKGLRLSDETAAKVKSTFKGMFSVFSILWEVAKGVAGVFVDIVKALVPVGDGFLDVTASIGDFLTNLRDTITEGGTIKGVFEGLGDVLSTVIEKITNLFGGFSDAIAGVDSAGFADFFKGLLETVRDFGSKIAEVLKGIDFGDILGAIGVGSLVALYKKISGFIDGFTDKMKKASSGGGLLDNIKEVFGGLTDSLSAMTTTLNASSLLMIAGAIGILAVSLNTISKIDEDKLMSSLAAIGALFAQMAGFLAVFSKAVAGGALKGMFGAAVGMMLMATAVGILASAVKKLSDLDWKELAVGLTGTLALVGGLALATKVMTPQKRMISTGLGLIALAAGVKILASAAKDMAELDWGEIARGLTGVGVLLGGIALFTRASKMDSLGVRTGLALIGIAGAMKLMASAIKDIGEIDGESLVKGVGGITGILGAIGIFTRINDPKKMLSASLSLVVISYALKDLGEALAQVGSLSWEEIGRGLTGIGGALLELGLVLGILGSVSPVGGLVASGAVLIAAQSLADIADALKDIGKLSWEEIARGLVGMGGALLELGVTVGLLGVVAPIGGILGSGAILLGVQSLADIADALEDIGELSWDEIARGLVGMGGALVEIGVVAGLLGTLAPVAGLLGAGTILLAVQSLGDIADALKKFGSMSWDEIGRGLTAMGGALAEIAVGSIANSLGIIGAMSISVVAEPLGVLADSVKKWTTVTLPKTLSSDLANLAFGVEAFTFAFGGAFSIAILAGELGTLADDVRAWNGVKMPPTLSDDLRGLAFGVEAFTFAFGGAFSIGLLTPDLGNLANDVKAWNGVKMSPTLSDDLSGLAKGVEAFSLAFMGGWSISTITPDLGNLASDVKAWNGVSVTKELERGLKGLANGLEAFSFLFMSGWSLSALTGPLGDLAGSVQKWEGIQVPPDIESGLQSIANGINAFPDVTQRHNTIKAVTPRIKELADATRSWDGLGFLARSLGGWLADIWEGVSAFPDRQNQHNTIKSLTDPIKDLAGAVRRWDGTRVPADFDTQMQTLMDGINNIQDMGDISQTIANLDNLKSSMTGWSFSGAVTQVTNISTALGKFNSQTQITSSLVIASFTLMRLQVISQAKLLAQGIKTEMGRITTAMKPIGKSVTDSLFQIVRAFVSMRPVINAAAAGAVSGMVSSVIRSLSGAGSALYSAARAVGLQVANGMVSGINSGNSRVSSAARDMATQAMDAAKASLGVKSPSREFMYIGEYVGEGFAIGIRDNTKAAVDSTTSMSEQVLDVFSGTIQNIRDIVEMDLDMSPVIRPVIDTTDIDAKANYVNGKMSSIKTSAMNSSRIGARDEILTSARTESKPVTVQFNQVNNSPKALSRIEIYRQTNNQLAGLKGALR